jgi:hypothetical protein
MREDTSPLSQLFKDLISMNLFKALVNCTPEGIDYLAYLYRARMSRFQHYRVIALYNQAKANSSENSAQVYNAPIIEEEKI